MKFALALLLALGLATSASAGEKCHKHRRGGRHHNPVVIVVGNGGYHDGNRINGRYVWGWFRTEIYPGHFEWMWRKVWIND